MAKIGWGLAATLVISGLVRFSPGEHELGYLEHLVRDGYDGFLVSSSMFHNLNSQSPFNFV